MELLRHEYYWRPASLHPGMCSRVLALAFSSLMVTLLISFLFLKPSSPFDEVGGRSWLGKTL